jgi:heme exporter protein C
VWCPISKLIAIAALNLLLLASGWAAALFFAPVDAIQGEVYRIIYVHVPVALATFYVTFLLFFSSVRNLISSKATLKQDNWMVSCSEVALIFGILLLATGSIWGKPTWNVWWTWDARLTTSLLLVLMLAGFLILHGSLQSINTRVRSCSVLGILITLNLPIIYQSVNWWRTLHQPQSLLREGGSTMDPTMLKILIANLVIILVVSTSMVLVRYIVRDRQSIVHGLQMKGMHR